MICLGCSREDQAWRRVDPRWVYVLGVRHKLMKHVCGYTMAVAEEKVA